MRERNLGLVQVWATQETLFIALEVPVLSSLFDFSYCCETKRKGSMR